MWSPLRRATEGFPGAGIEGGKFYEANRVVRNHGIGSSARARRFATLPLAINSRDALLIMLNMTGVCALIAVLGHQAPDQRGIGRRVFWLYPCYKKSMTDGPENALVSLAQVPNARLVAMPLHEIEGNPLSADQVAMFEMFERLQWSHERRRTCILSRAAPLAAE
jgi:hypothetical protein